MGAFDKSLSSRRAWIEMSFLHQRHFQVHGSLSSRRAWIEIHTPARQQKKKSVALLAEGVD